MIYGEEQIEEFAEERMQRLLNTEYEPPDISYYDYRSTEIRDSRAMREADANSRLFRAVFENDV